MKYHRSQEQQTHNTASQYRRAKTCNRHKTENAKRRDDTTEFMRDFYKTLRVLIDLETQWSYADRIPPTKW